MNKPRKKKKKKIHSSNKENRWHELSDHVNRSNKPRLHSDNINKGVLSDPFALRQYWAHISKKKKKGVRTNKVFSPKTRYEKVIKILKFLIFSK